MEGVPMKRPDRRGRYHLPDLVDIGAERARSEAFEKILKGSQRAATIVSSMLGFARNQSHQREFTDLAKLVEEVFILTEKDLSKHHIQIEKQLYDRIQAPVVPGQIEQI